jgi:hypothetical protein
MTAGVFGAVYTLIGLLGFAGPLTPGDNLLGIFPISPTHNIVHLLIGVTGLAVYFAWPAMTRQWAQVFGVVLALVAVLGVIVANPLNILPIGGFDIALHAASAAVLLYVGFAGTRQETAAA